MEFKSLLDFLKKLKKNNNKEWFDKNKKEYESLRADFITFIGEVIGDISSYNKAVSGLEAKKTIFRINRDIRFSKDKSPYKSNFGANMAPGGKNAMNAGYYIHFEPGNCFIAGGLYMPDPNNLANVRQEIDYNLVAFEKIIREKNYKKFFNGLGGEKLSRPPKGYEADNPAIDYLKHKHFLAYHEVSDKEVMDKNYRKYVASTFKAMHPLVDFLNKAIGK